MLKLSWFGKAKLCIFLAIICGRRYYGLSIDFNWSFIAIELGRLGIYIYWNRTSFPAFSSKLISFY